jgi:hypothetical protein
MENAPPATKGVAMIHVRIVVKARRVVWKRTTIPMTMERIAAMIVALNHARTLIQQRGEFT